MKKKICIIHTNMCLGGAETSLLGLLQSFDYEKYDVDLKLFSKEGELLELIPKQVNVTELPESYHCLMLPIVSVLKKGHFALVGARLYGKLKGRNAAEKTYKTKLYAQKAAMPFLKKLDGDYDLAISFIDPHFVLCQKVNAKTKIGWFHTDFSIVEQVEKLDRKMWGDLDAVVNVSQSCKAEFDRFFPELAEKSIVIENVLSKAFIEKRSLAFEPTDMKKESGVLTLLSVGRFCEAKNFDNVPDICKRLENLGVNVRWYLIGYGGDEALIREKIKESKTDEKVIVLGQKDNPYPYMRKCDVYVQPSRYEGKCVAVREAQILNKPVVITNYKTSASQLENGVDGMIVSLENEKCARELAEILKNKELLKTLSENTKKRDYTNESQIEKIYRLC